jgi:hypothetical protein
VVPRRTVIEGDPAHEPWMNPPSECDERARGASSLTKQSLDTDCASEDFCWSLISFSLIHRYSVIALGRGVMDVPRKPLAKSEGRKKLRSSGLVIQWRGTANLDDWVAFIANGTRSKRLILADRTSERRVKALLSRLEGLTKKEIEKLAKG